MDDEIASVVRKQLRMIRLVNLMETLRKVSTVHECHQFTPQCRYGIMQKRVIILQASAGSEVELVNHEKVWKLPV